MSAPTGVADQRRWQRSEWHGEEAGPAFPQDPQDDGGGQDDGGHDDPDRLEDKRPDQVERLTPHGADRFTKLHEAIISKQGGKLSCFVVIKFP